MPWLRTCAILFSGLLLTAISHNASLANDDWQTIVTEDVWMEHACKVTYFSHIVERQTDSGTVVLVKVHCEDGRSFDASQLGTDHPFTFSECTPREKTSC